MAVSQAPLTPARARLSLFGKARLESEDGPAQFATRKGLGLLAYLAAQRHPVSRDELAALLWPEQSQEQARHNLRQELWRLGRHLGAQRLTTERTQVCLRAAGLDVDLWDFWAARAEERHAEAVERYGGPFLQGLTLPDGGTFEIWLVTMRETLQREVLESLSATARDLEGRGRYHEALAVARRAIAIDPLAEEFSLAAMRLAHRGGDRAGALRIFSALGRALRHDLGVEPSEDTRRLAQEIGLGKPAAPPVPSPSFALVGRHGELTELRALLTREDCRLLTLLGYGGVGKTRLAIALAHEVQGASLFPDGVVWVGLQGPHLLPRLVDALGLPLYGRGDLQGAVLHRLRNRHALLILDEAETLGEDRLLLDTMLEAAPRLKILLTSRERLRLRSEWTYHVHGLPVPDPDAAAGRDALVGQSPAVQLFCRMAERVSPGCRPSGDDWPAIAALCRLLGGLPLGLELAAAWVRVLSCQELRRELEQSLNLVEQGPPARSAGQTNLRAIVESTLARLSSDERDTLVRLSAFHGGFTLDAARHVAAATPAILATLADRALLRQAESGRHHVIDVVRLQVRHALAPGTRDAHAAYYAAFLEAREAEFKGDGQPRALRDVGAEIENIRAAWAWALERRRADLVLEMMEGLFLFHVLRGWFQQGAELFAVGQTLPDDHVRAKMLSRLGRLGFRLGRYGDARATLAQALELARRERDVNEVAFALNGQGLAALGMGRPLDALERLREGLELHRLAGDHWGMANNRLNLGLVALMAGEYAGARTDFEEAMSLYRTQGDLRGMSLALGGLGQAQVAAGALVVARDLFQQALALSETLGDRSAAASALLGAGFVELLLDRPTESRERLEASLKISREVGDRAGMVRALLTLGSMAARARDLQGAARMQEEALAVAREASFGWGEALALAQLAETLRAAGDAKGAAHHMLRALSRAQELQTVPLLLRVLLAAAGLLEPPLAAALLAFVQAHPASEYDIRTEAEQRLHHRPPCARDHIPHVEEAAAAVMRTLEPVARQVT